MLSTEQDIRREGASSHGDADRYVIIRKFYFQLVMGTEIAIQVTLLNIHDFSLPADSYDAPSKLF
jgi:hypothetical protein